MAYGNPQRLYVLSCEDGILKGGITSRSFARVREHARRSQVVAHFVSDFVCGVRAERELLARLSHIGTLCHGREWFSGIAFADASQIAQQVAREFPNLNPASKAHLLRKPFSAVRFNEPEMDVIDAYCERFGMSRGAACRRLLLEAVRAGAHEKNFARPGT